MESALWSSTDTQRHRFTRRQLVAAGVLPDTRRAPRIMTIAPAAITTADAQRHTGLVRDLSASGIFVYSNFRPHAGDRLQLLVRLSTQGAKLIVLACTGAVVRVEEGGTGAAFGIALEIASYELLINGTAVAAKNAFARITEQLQRSA